MNIVNQVGVVILNYNNWEETIGCIESILKSNYPAVQIVVVDNASTNDSYNRVQERFSLNRAKYRNVICISSEKNGGYAYGNNIGIKYCSDQGMQYAIITNGDVLFEVNTISHLMETLAAKENCVIAAPKILNSVGLETSIPMTKKMSFSQFIASLSWEKLSPKDVSIQVGERNKQQQIYSMSGCCFALNIPLFKQMGALDEGTFLYGEEAIMAVQAHNAGFEIWYEPKAIVTHNHKHSNSLFSDFTLIKSCLYYWKKYENGKRYQLALLKGIFLSKIITKTILGRYESRENFSTLYKDLIKYYSSILKADF